MSSFEQRTELWEGAMETIDLAEEDLRELYGRLSDEAPRDRLRSLAAFAEEYAFETEWGIGGVEDSFVARTHRFNEEDMRKGMRHGHVAIVVCCDTDLSADIVASMAAAIGTASTLVKVYGQVSVIAIADSGELRTLTDEGVFSIPDCVFTFSGSTEGMGFQHTITSSANHMAAASIDLEYVDGSGLELRELHAAVKTLIDDLEEPESVKPSETGFDIVAFRWTRVQEIVEQISALVRARAESSGVSVKITTSPIMKEMLPSRILARRVKSFTDTMKVKLDRVQKRAYEAPTRWGTVSHEVGTAIIRYPLYQDDERPDAVSQAVMIAKAVSGAGLDLFGDMEFRGFVEGERVRALRERDLKRTPRRWLGVHPVLPPKDGRTRTINIPDVIVRGPGLPEPTLDELIEDDESS